MQHSWLLVFSLVLVGCASDALDDDAALTAPAEIRGGTSASAFVEAALVDSEVSEGTERCSGAAIAPRLVLTAGHCLRPGDSFRVRLPYARKSGKGRKSWSPYVPTGNAVNPASIDIAVLILDAPLDLPSYPELATTPVPAGTPAMNVGRVRNGDTSSSQLYAGATVQLVPSPGFPNAYQSASVIEVGDSGGPVYVGAGANRRIVAVGSGASRTVQVMARVDLVQAQIQQLVRQYAD